MPSPLVHSVTGYVIWRLFGMSRDGSRRDPSEWGVPALVFCVVVSTVPDLDFVFGWLAGNPGAYHNQIMNSAVAGGVVSLLAASLARPLIGLSFGRALVVALVCYGVHIVMDYWTHGRGRMLLWPFTDRRFEPPFEVFYGVRWSQGLISRHHLWTLLTEAVFVAGMLALVAAIGRREQRSLGPPAGE